MHCQSTCTLSRSGLRPTTATRRLVVDGGTTDSGFALTYSKTTLSDDADNRLGNQEWSLPCENPSCNRYREPSLAGQPLVAGVAVGKAIVEQGRPTFASVWRFPDGRPPAHHKHTRVKVSGSKQGSWSPKIAESLPVILQSTVQTTS